MSPFRAGRIFLFCDFIIFLFMAFMFADTIWWEKAKFNIYIIYLLFKYLNPSTVGSEHINVKEREKERQVRRKDK